MNTKTPTETTKRERQKERRRQRAEAQRREAQRRRVTRTFRNVGLAVLAVVVVFGAAVWLGRGADVTLGVDEPEVAADAQPLPPADPAGADPAVGQAAPAATGADLDGNPVRIGEGSGQAQAIAFMAHWCPHCQEEVPEVAEWVASEPLPDGVQLVAVSTQHEPSRPNWPPDDWLVDAGWPGDVLVDSTDVVNEAYALTGTPYWVFVDADGTVTSRASGRIGETQFREALEEIAA